MPRPTRGCSTSKEGEYTLLTFSVLGILLLVNLSHWSSLSLIMNRTENTASNSTSIVTCVIVAAGMCCLATA
jgi:hypothetical protein